MGQYEHSTRETTETKENSLDDVGVILRKREKAPHQQRSLGLNVTWWGPRVKPTGSRLHLALDVLDLEDVLTGHLVVSRHLHVL